MKATVEVRRCDDTVVAWLAAVASGRYRQSDCFLYRQGRHHSDGCRYRCAGVNIIRPSSANDIYSLINTSSTRQTRIGFWLTTPLCHCQRAPAKFPDCRHGRCPWHLSGVSIRNRIGKSEGTGITRAEDKRWQCSYDTLPVRTRAGWGGLQGAHAVTPALEAIVEANVYLSGVGAIMSTALPLTPSSLTALPRSASRMRITAASRLLVLCTVCSEGATKEE